MMLPLNAVRHDIGFWSSVWDISDKDELGNVAIGDALLLETYNPNVRPDGNLIADVGASDLVIVATKDSVLVAEKDCSQGTKVIAKRIKAGSREE